MPDQGTFVQWASSALLRSAAADLVTKGAQQPRCSRNTCTVTYVSPPFCLAHCGQPTVTASPDDEAVFAQSTFLPRIDRRDRIEAWSNRGVIESRRDQWNQLRRRSSSTPSINKPGRRKRSGSDRVSRPMTVFAAGVVRTFKRRYRVPAAWFATGSSVTGVVGGIAIPDGVHGLDNSQRCSNEDRNLRQHHSRDDGRLQFVSTGRVPIPPLKPAPLLPSDMSCKLHATSQSQHTQTHHELKSTLKERWKIPACAAVCLYASRGQRQGRGGVLREWVVGQGVWCWGWSGVKL